MKPATERIHEILTHHHPNPVCTTVFIRRHSFVEVSGRMTELETAGVPIVRGWCQDRRHRHRKGSRFRTYQLNQQEDAS